MSKATTKATIDANIKQNGVQSITGPVLNTVLNAMVDDYGAQEDLTTLNQKVNEVKTELHPETLVVLSTLSQSQVSANAGTYTNYQVLDKARVGDRIRIHIINNGGVVNSSVTIGLLNNTTAVVLKNLETRSLNGSDDFYIEYVSEFDNIGHIYIRPIANGTGGVMSVESWIVRTSNVLDNLNANINSNTAGINTINKQINAETQTISVVQNTDSGNNAYFVKALLGNAAIFRLVCNDGSVRRYGVRGNSGADIEINGQYTPDYYRFVPNEWYFVNISTDIKAQPFFGCYINAANCVSNGSAKFEIIPAADSTLWNIIRGNDSSKKLKGKTIWTLCDSLGHNTPTNKGWQPKFVELSGCNWDAQLNVKPDAPLSWGGTESMPWLDDGTQARARNLLQYRDEGKPIDYIFVECVNDNHYLPYTMGTDEFVGTINDKPFMRRQHIVITPTTTLTTNAEAKAYIENNFASIVNSIPSAQRLAGTVISVPVTPSGTPNGSKITFGGSVTSNGNVSLVYGGTTYAVPVQIGMTLNDIVDSFVRYSYGSGVSDVNNGDGSMSIFSNNVPSWRITSFNGQGTGVTATITDIAGSENYPALFKGDTATEFMDISNWSVGRRTTLYAVYKGLLSFLQRQFPTAKIYWFLPYSVNPGSFSSTQFKDGAGLWSQDLFRASNNYKNREDLFEIQRNACKYYGVPVIDIFNEGDMSICNIETYFNQNDVHPKAVGYDRWAEFMYTKM